MAVNEELVNEGRGFSGVAKGHTVEDRKNKERWCRREVRAREREKDARSQSRKCGVWVFRVRGENATRGWGRRVLVGWLGLHRAPRAASLIPRAKRGF